MEYKCLLGSKMLKLNNCRDDDSYVFVDKAGSTIKEKNHTSIPLFKAFIRHFIQGKNAHVDPYKSLYIFQLSSGFHEGAEYPFADFNILEHKAVWIAHLKRYMNDEGIEQRATSKDILPKNFYHILYQYYMIVENVHFISDEAKVNVQKIHDLEVPSAYFYELRDLINSLQDVR